MTWRQKSGVWSLKVGAASLVVALVGLLVWWATLLTDDRSGTTRSAPATIPRGQPTTIGPLGTVSGIRDNLTSGIATFNADTVLFADGPSLRAADVNSGGTYDFVYKPLTSGPGSSLRDVAVGPGGAVYVTNEDGQLIRLGKGDPEVLLGSKDHLLPPAVTPPDLRGVAATPDGRVYVADIVNDRIIVRSPVGEVSVLSASVDMPDDMTTDPSGRPYVADSKGHIFRISLDGQLHLVFDIAKARSSFEQMDSGYLFFAFTPHGDLIVADELNNLIFRQRGTQIWRVVGDGRNVVSRDGVAGRSASISSPWAVDVTADNRLIFSESGKLRAVQLDD